jgi:hypothetical protein
MAAGVKSQLEAAKKDLEAAKKDLEAVKANIDKALNATDAALATHLEKKKVAGGGLKKLGTTMDSLKALAGKAPFNVDAAIKLIQQGNAAVDEVEKAAGAD